jgi:hypothetical protein
LPPSFKRLWPPIRPEWKEPWWGKPRVNEPAVCSDPKRMYKAPVCCKFQMLGVYREYMAEKCAACFDGCNRWSHELPIDERTLPGFALCIRQCATDSPKAEVRVAIDPDQKYVEAVKQCVKERREARR